MRFFTLFLTTIFLAIPEILSVFFIMPIGNSQEMNAAEWAYFFYNYSWIFRILGLGLFFYIAQPYWMASKKILPKIGTVLLLIVYLAVAYMVNFVMRADKMFYQPNHKILAKAANNQIEPQKLVMGVFYKNEARAYPVQFLGYHHQVVDTIGNEPLIITYCTVCRTGRVFSSLVNGKNESFRLVGMSQYNAMFEDATTKSWWQQETGEAIFGSLKGTKLTEIPYQQMTLENWLKLYPESLIMQPDPDFSDQYARMESYEDGGSKNWLTMQDTSSWQNKSWIIGVVNGSNAKAYDWNELRKNKIIQDDLNGLPLVLVLGKDGKSFYAWERKNQSTILNFIWDKDQSLMVDTSSNSFWNEYGFCVQGDSSLINKKLKSVQAYQEYWHSWQTFHAKYIVK